MVIGIVDVQLRISMVNAEVRLGSSCLVAIRQRHIVTYVSIHTTRHSIGGERRLPALSSYLRSIL